MDGRFENLHACIEFFRNKFIDIQEQYNIAKYELEFEDAKYKEDENNIFGDIRYKKLSEFIETEAKLYRADDFHYSEIKNIIDTLISNINKWRKSLQYRKIQGISEAKRVYNSEKYYLKDMEIRLQYFSSILDCLIDMENVEDTMPALGVEISADSEYEIFLLNKCVLLNQISYCRKKCTNILLGLNKRISNSDRFNSEFLYKVGELNFELQNYNDAQLFLGRAIKKLEIESSDDKIMGRENDIVNDMLFSAYQLQILGYEFCGFYDKAIYLLVDEDSSFLKWNSNSNAGIECARKVVNIFDQRLSDIGGVKALAYSSDNTEEAKQKRIDIISWIDNIFCDSLFNSPIFNYVRKETNQIVFERLVDYENDKLQKRITKCKKGDKEKRNLVYNTNMLLKENNNILFEYIHILAHCLNEYGVTCFRKYNNSIKDCSRSEEEFIQNLILLGRALMLYVSEKLSIYKTCYATTYAEAGDFAIAKNELESVLNSEKYKKADVTTKAEIIFFTYLINSLDKIERGNYRQFWKKDELYDRYLNYCYRSFDYDAIAHMRVYDFRHSMASIMQHQDLREMAHHFYAFSENKDSTGKTPYEKFVSEVYFQNTNRRLKCEYEKVKYMYHFLQGLFERFEEDYQYDLEKDRINTVKILDYALKYMHYHNLLLDESIDDQINYVDSTQIESIKKIFPNVDIKSNGIISEFCEIVILSCEDEKKKFIEDLPSMQRDKSNRMFFVVCEDYNLLRNELRKDKRIKMNNIKNVRFFKTREKGIYEFVILNTFFNIKSDFSDTKNIFILTPIGTAQSCKYRVGNDIELILDGFNPQYKVDLDQPKNILTQYNAVAERFWNEEPWERKLNDPRLAREISLVIGLMYNKEGDKTFTKYRYKYSVSDDWKDAVLFLPTSLIHMMDDLYDDDTYDRTKEHIDCNSPQNNCSVQRVDNIKNWNYDEYTFEEIEKSFPEVSFNNVECLLLWYGEMGSFVSWRMVFLKRNFKRNYIGKIMQIMCSSGKGPIFTPNTGMIEYKWPEPFDYEIHNDNFLFICHSGNDDEIVKKELNEFFMQNHIPVWYDKDKFVNDRGWKERIQNVIQNKQCVGCVVMITNSRFFGSEAIRFEILLADAECKRCHDVQNGSKKNFAIIPIVYGIDNSEESKSKLELLKEMMRGSISDLDNLTRIEKCIIPRSDKVITFVNKNQSLAEYTEKEIKEGRNGSILRACTELGINV